MTVYHGSKNKFNNFDYSFIRTNGTSEGIGFYFTDNLDVAKTYGFEGFIYTISLNFKKSMSNEKLTITKIQLKKFLKQLNKNILKSNNNETDYLSNYDDVEYYGLENVLNKAVELEYNYSNNDVDLISCICNASGNFEVTLNTLYEVLGYDSIVTKADWGNQTIYIALVNDIIEINKIEEHKEN